MVSRVGFWSCVLAAVSLVALWSVCELSLVWLPRGLFGLGWCSGLCCRRLVPSVAGLRGVALSFVRSVTSSCRLLCSGSLGVCLLGNREQETRQKGGRSRGPCMAVCGGCSIAPVLCAVVQCFAVFPSCCVALPCSFVASVISACAFLRCSPCLAVIELLLGVLFILLELDLVLYSFML